MNYIRTEVVTTRKPVTCWGCCRTLPTGTVIEKNTSAGDDGIVTAAWCATCLVMMPIMEEFLDPMGDGWGFGCMVEDYRDGFLDVMYETEFWPS